MADFRNIVILTGAGRSPESGLSTFRDKDGIWTKYDYREVATPEGFRSNPRLVHEFYNGAGAGSTALSRTRRTSRSPSSSASIRARSPSSPRTSNRCTAGSRNLIHMHGQLLKALCAL
jgi:NAD-dependent deacetylase